MKLVGQVSNRQFFVFVDVEMDVFQNINGPYSFKRLVYPDF